MDYLPHMCTSTTACANKSNLSTKYSRECLILVSRLDNCVFGSTIINFLGHNINSNSISPLPEVISHSRFSLFLSVGQLKCFINLVNFYWRFTPNWSLTLQKNKKSFILQQDTVNATKFALTHFMKLLHWQWKWKSWWAQMHLMQP